MDDDRKAGVAKALYTGLLYLLSPAVTLWFALPEISSGGRLRRLGERLGFVDKSGAGCTIWVHAVSVGEVQAAAPLLRRLLQERPSCRIWVTTTTATGSAHLRRLFPEGLGHSYLPYDTPGAVQRFLRRIRPALLVVMETELWPNLFAACRKSGIPIVIANARLSPRSVKTYNRFKTLIGETLDAVSRVAAQGEGDAQRFVSLGAPVARVVRMGNLKYDLSVPEGLAEKAAALRASWGSRPVWIAASTREGEEEQILDAFERVRGQRPECLLVLVPRHPQRFDKVRALCERRGLVTVSRSRGEAAQDSTQVFLVDVMGELLLFYAAADIAFVGGSLVPVGGHNMLEPAALGLPVITGPYLDNTRDIARHLAEAGAAFQVADGEDLAVQVLQLLGDEELRGRAGMAGRRVVEQNRGSLDRLLALIEPHLPK